MSRTPDNWVVIKFKGKDPHYKVLAGWSGGYTSSDSWRMNSGIVKVEDDDDFFYFYGHSGSCYRCHKEMYGLRNNNAYAWNSLEKKHKDLIELMDEDTDWLNIDWIIHEGSS